MNKWYYKRNGLYWGGQFSRILPSQCIWNLAWYKCWPRVGYCITGFKFMVFNATFNNISILHNSLNVNSMHLSILLWVWYFREKKKIIAQILFMFLKPWQYIYFHIEIDSLYFIELYCKRSHSKSKEWLTWNQSNVSEWRNLSVTCDRSVVFSGYCSFLHQ